METPESVPKPQKRADLRDYLAAERTFLAWIRTGLALMGFGFVVARFGLFLQQMQMMQNQAGRSASMQSHGLSLWIGTALIVAGVVIHVLSAMHHATLLRQLDEGQISSSSSPTRAIVIALFLALLGLVMAAYLVWIRGPHP